MPVVRGLHLDLTAIGATFKVASVTYALWHPSRPALPLEQCSDKERYISATCWNLQAVQQALTTDRLNLTISTGASATMSQELHWGPNDVRSFMQCLHKGRYEGSEWCLPSNHKNKNAAYAADVYVMGFNRFKCIENQKIAPWTYLKFSIINDNKNILILSAHPSDYT